MWWFGDLGNSIDLRNMFGGSDNRNPLLPVFLEQEGFQYGGNALPQLQLFGDVPVACGVDPLNYMGNKHATATNRPIKRGRETEPASGPQKFQISTSNNFFQYETGLSGRILNQNPVSTGLRLSYEDDERNSSVTSASEGMKAFLPGIVSLSDNLKIEIDRQGEEMDHYIRLQEANIMKGIRELKQKQTVSLLNALDKELGKKLHEKQLEIDDMNRKNKELTERIKQFSMETNAWQCRAKYSESVVNALKSNIQQVVAQGGVPAREGWGDSEVDGAASYSGKNFGNQQQQLKCRACKGKEVRFLLMPCRHLCLCEDCEGVVDVCPVCQGMKTASVQVLMP
ncbi:E3 ubiquitin-protein ligase BOI-like isoform X1 [Rhododendron vialii]|uniref:E3 ubiquitin-protein ligase BOI-like isoform X1 n=2 Tax=Rhododendron vialii TaxID=182163 RepID=UPI00265E4917|nr:E3 ubiquitin-protein ligase BOI-like isoform X1 [Rhododendron vialii]